MSAPSVPRLQAPPRPASAEETSTLAIGGMTCASCVAHVTRALRRVPGVADAHVNLAAEHAVVVHDAAVEGAVLVDAVARAGYTGRVLDESDQTAAPDADARGHEREVRRKRATVIFGLVLLVPSLVLGMTGIAVPAKDGVMLALAVAAWAIVGWEFHRGALLRLRHGSANMDSLVSLGSTAAVAYSIYATLTMRPAYDETAVAIVTLVALGKYLESAARRRTNAAVRSLLALRPPTALLRLASGETRSVPAENVRVGDVVLVRPGERIPVDGVVSAGDSSIDVALLTGEPLPQTVGPGANVTGGSLNGDGALDVRATAVGAGSTLARIVRVVQQAQGSRAPVQRLADHVAAVFVPIILGVAALTAAGWILAGRPGSEALLAAVAVLVVACPCAMGLATPTAVMVAVGVGARRGILFKDAAAIEAAARVRHVVFDKTGTLTAGRPDVVGVAPAAAVDERHLLAVAAAVEATSAHPLAAAIVRAAQAHAAPDLRATGGAAVRGRGVRAVVDGRPAAAGTRAFLELEGFPPAAFEALQPARSAATEVFVGHAGELLGRLDLADPLRPEAREAVAAVRRLGADVAIVSGDASPAVAAVAAALGIGTYRAQTLPEAKAVFVAELQTRGEVVAFVGDGINDAPALATADVGIAMGGGSEIATETAHVALLLGDPQAVATALTLARAGMRTIRQNLFWAFAYNVVLVPLAAFGVVQPIFAAAAMGLSSVFVVGNALRLRLQK